MAVHAQYPAVGALAQAVMTVERFAPSPNGWLHLGHAYSALLGFRAARAAGGRFLLRIEDIDTTRSRPEFVQGIFEDLRWLGLSWVEPVWFQSTRMAVYAEALGRLRNLGVIYGCRCSRRDIQLAAPQEGDAPSVYPGLCRGSHLIDAPIWRLNMAAALELVGSLSWQEVGVGAGSYTLDPAQMLTQHGDVVLARRDVPTSYHLAVVVDDAAQGVTHVTRGVDLQPATAIHRLLQALLGLPTPIYRHHPLVRDADGRRLAKRDQAFGLRQWRAAGQSPEALIAMLPPFS